MREISLVYVANRLGYRILAFFQHWYLNGFLTASGSLLNVLERLDHFFALKITFKNLFQPLYRDYSLIGYLWGFVFRSLRLIAGGLVYGIILLITGALYLVWAAIPIYIIYKIIFNVIA